MSILYYNNIGSVVSHADYINSIYNIAPTASARSFLAQDGMFSINTPYRTEEQALKAEERIKLADPESGVAVERKRKRPVSSEYETLATEVKLIQDTYPKLVSEAKRQGHFKFTATAADVADNNSQSRAFAEEVFRRSTLAGTAGDSFSGGNTSGSAVVASVGGDNYVIPPHCTFHCRDISSLSADSIQESNFHLAVIDPPWWNKYIRRRKARDQQSSYEMMRTEDVGRIQLQSLLAPGALVAVWCTNSPSHIRAVHTSLFPQWALRPVATWFWLKVDRSGTPVCNFSPPPGKQPYERIIFGRSAADQLSTVEDPKDGLIVVSVPSAVHSHKPPLLELLKPYVAGSPRVLELFARSLLPGVVSCGLEVLKLQHQFLFKHTPLPETG